MIETQTVWRDSVCRKYSKTSDLCVATNAIMHNASQTSRKARRWENHYSGLSADSPVLALPTHRSFFVAIDGRRLRGSLRFVSLLLVAYSVGV